jgi:hypothetical protein
VLTAAAQVRAALAGAAPERLWALSDTEVAEAMATLAWVHAMAQAQLVAVLAEARSRGSAGLRGGVRGTGPGCTARGWSPGW